jgi:hypothetical protein
MAAPSFTAAELRACAQRELQLRKRVYPNRVETGRMSAAEARRQLAMMQAILDHLKECEKAELLL